MLSYLQLENYFYFFFSDEKIEKTVIVFLTDGVDARLYGTKTVEQKWFQSLMASVENSAGRSSITIHAVGFSKGICKLLYI